MKSYFEDLRIRLSEGVPFPTHLIDHAESPFRLGGFVPQELDYGTLEAQLEKRLRVRDEAHMPILRANMAQYGLGIRRPVLLPRITVAAALAGHVWTFPPIKETHKAAYDAIHDTIKRDNLYFDTLTSFVSMGTRTGRFSSTVPNKSASPSNAVYEGARGNGKTFMQQNSFKREYLMYPYQKAMLDEIRALHSKGWKL